MSARAAEDPQHDSKKQKTTVQKKVCLIVHDGWGLSDNEKGNAVFHGDSTSMDAIRDNHNFVPLAAHGLAVGLKDGLMGNSEDIVRIDQSIKTDEFKNQPSIVASLKHAKETNGRLHLMGLLSDGGVHSHITHLLALVRAAKEQGVPHVYIHAFGDGRDTAPKSATKYVQELLDALKDIGCGELVTFVGRYYAMDRDKRWDRVKVAVDALVQGEGDKADDPVKALEESYANGLSDEFVKPLIFGDASTRIQDNDTVFTYNYRSDRMREITSLFAFEDKPIDVEIPKGLNITTMSRYNPEWTLPVAFPPVSMDNVLAEWLGKQGVKQMHIAGKFKYAHVTFFFNGGVEQQYTGEERGMVPSPKVATYDKQPEMSAQAVADKVAEVVKTNEFEFVMCNFAPPDMVGHTGVYDAAVKAISATDAAVKTVYDACEEAGYILCITSDHGNAEQMLDPETGNPHTAHTTNPVPFIVTGEKGLIKTDVTDGALADVAPTILAIMGLPQPDEMTGKSIAK
ncbi:uncharacterized protein EHS24_009675 [Apiotrichum porosum]|uniref:2,3-bisphosphoglycerate-independent phosphoglycerate mutase n=1 Tax=Apiotrichum porosum TaxID=105984 RepID=A0A427XMM5_9TREE|nr:uncharacterized protein EHS24_009675 [Apiotrichum porosum]RSH80004.1 hypothetical protein EHS24_009675 [Apiotrichum porosum]